MATDPRTRGKSTLKLFSHQIQAGKNIRGEITQDDIIEKKDSIRAIGLLQPLKVFRLKGEEIYTLIDGETRWRGICLGIDLGEFPADFQIICLQSDEYSELDILDTQIEINRGREIPILNVAKAYREMMHFGRSEKDIAMKHGTTVQRVKEVLEMLNLTPDLQAKIEKKEVSPTLVIERLNKGRKSQEINSEINAAQKETGKKRITKKHLPAIPVTRQTDLTKSVSKADQYRTWLTLQLEWELVDVAIALEHFNEIFNK